MAQIFWTPVAESDLENILYDFAYHQRRYVAGTKLLNEFRHAALRAVGGVFPGHHHPSAPADWLYMQHKRWLIFYRYLESDVQVMRVVDAARDLPSLLKGAD